ncbi:MAG TPA: hypothetical protein GXX29_12695 [Firmicutes bacterium]|nr:hypothetical protein [Bacillota bacterium]
MSDSRPVAGQICAFLEREDKWYLGGGGNLIWAPAFPAHPYHPGFWDNGQYFDIPVPGFVLSIINIDVDIDMKADRRQELTPLLRRKTWRPSHLTIISDLIPGELVLREERAVLYQDILVSQLTLTNAAPATRHVAVAAWTALTPEDITAIVADEWEGLIRCRHAVLPGLSSELRLQVSTDRPESGEGAEEQPPPKPAAWIQFCQGLPKAPQWRLTPFHEWWLEQWDVEEREGNISPHLDPPSSAAAKPTAGDTALAAAAVAHPVTAALIVKLVIPPQAEVRLVATRRYFVEEAEDKEPDYGAGPDGALRAAWFAPASSSSAGLAPAPSAAAALDHADLIKASCDHWERFFSSVPFFSCSDPYLTKYYWYRWYGLHLCSCKGGAYHHPYPFVCEGIDEFRRHIFYSVPAQIYETRWLKKPDLTYGALLGLLLHQDADGRLPSHIGAKQILYRPRFFDWGGALREAWRVHPDMSFLATAYDHLKRFFAYLEKTCDPDGDGLFSVINNIAGTSGPNEHMPRWLEGDPVAGGKDRMSELETVDVNTYAYNLLDTLAWAAAGLGEKEEAALFARKAKNLKRRMLELMWDPEQECFCDIAGRSHRKVTSLSFTSFLPLATTLTGEPHLAALSRHLFNAKEFMASYPPTTISMQDPHFSPWGCRDGIRRNCPWNGRMWPMAASHLAEAAARGADLDPALAPTATQFIYRYIRTLFLDGHPERPNSFEHYNPFTGEPSLYRGIDDYQHSWIVDLIIKYVCGLRPGDEPDVVQIKPLPFALDWFRLENVPYKNHTIAIYWEGGILRGEVSERRVVQRTGLGPMYLELKGV